VKSKKLLIGKIPFANVFPFYHFLERKCDCSRYTFIEGVPSLLNKMIRDGKIDISPSSSIEYLRYKDNYALLPFFTISSVGPVSSILLFSKIPLEELDKKTIAVSSHSETSAMLLKIIMRNFLSLNPRYRTIKNGSLKKVLTSYPAYLLIGDEAMKEAKNLSTANRQPSTVYIYDLGELWFHYTGLPFVFALWIVRRKSLSKKKKLIEDFTRDLLHAKAYAVQKRTTIARHAPQKKWMKQRELVNYWGRISFDFTEKHLAGLELFEKYALKIDWKKGS
jgi:chorismate dehydratase